MRLMTTLTPLTLLLFACAEDRRMVPDECDLDVSLSTSSGSTIKAAVGQTVSLVLEHSASRSSENGGSLSVRTGDSGSVRIEDMNGPKQITEPSGSTTVEVTCLQPGTFTVSADFTWSPDCAKTTSTLIQVECEGDETVVTTAWRDDPEYDESLWFLDMLGTPQDEVDAAVHPNPDTSGCKHSDGVQSIPQVTSEVGLFGWFALMQELEQAELDALFNGPGARFGCGSNADAEVLCASPDPLVPGGFHLVGAVMHAPFPYPATRQYQYALTYDYDGIPDNNYKAPPAWPGDFFHDTDTWFVLNRDPVYGWSFASQLADNGNIRPAPGSTARVVVLDDALFYVIPADELPYSEAGYRLTAFSHPGDYGMGGVWEGDLERPIDQPLHAIPVIP